MRTAQLGDRVQVHYVIRSKDGSVASSCGRGPLELTVGIDHPRLPGLGSALVGLALGEATTLTVPPEQAYGLPDTARVARLPQQFTKDAAIQPGQPVRVTRNRRRRGLVHILEIDGKMVVVDSNNSWAGQALELRVELVAICGPDAGSNGSGSDREVPTRPASERPAVRGQEEGVAGTARATPRRARAVAFDVDPASLDSLREALPGWEVLTIDGASAASLSRSWDPGSADLLIVSAHENIPETLGLCRFLAFCTLYSTEAREKAAEVLGSHEFLPDRGPRGDAPLLVLVPHGQETLVGAALETGARYCLLLPIHHKEVTSTLAHAQAGNQPGRHTLNLDKAQKEDRWRDDGGQG